jgi:tetratricopeptide (TPR) repeat protein
VCGFLYAPFRHSVEQEGEAARQERDEKINRAAHLLLGDESAEARYAKGVLAALEQKFDKAVSLLEQAANERPGDATWLSDLAAVRLGKARKHKIAGEHGKALGELGRAIENLDTSSRIDGSLSEVLFNRALCHQMIGLLDHATPTGATI